MFYVLVLSEELGLLICLKLCCPNHAILFECSTIRLYHHSLGINVDIGIGPAMFIK